MYYEIVLWNMIEKLKSKDLQCFVYACESN